MKIPRGMTVLLLTSVAALVLAGCPLPFEYNGKGASSHSADPSSPNMTAAVTVSYSEEGGGSGSIPDGGAFASGKSTTVTLATASLNAVIFYTDDGTTLSDLRTATKIDASSGSFTITRTTTPQSLDIHAVAVGPNMLPSPAVHFTVAVTPYPILTVTRNNATISEDGGTATFTVTSSSASSSDITVNLETGGDYSTNYLTGLPGGPNTTFPATLVHGTTSIVFTVTGIHDPSTAGHTATLTVLADTNTPPAYTVGAPSSASLAIPDDGSHTVTYNGNGSGGGTAPVDNNYYVAGAQVTVLGAGSLVKTGYSFAGWNTQADGSGTPYAAGATFPMGSANVTLYAVWNVIQYTLTVSSSGNGTTSPAGGVSVTYGAATAITATPAPLSYLINWTVTAGSGVTFGSTGNATSTSTSDTVTLTGGNATVRANFALRDYYVNAVTGSDVNAGTSSGTAFKTITHALSVATVSGQTVNVAPGTYGAANGETFPFYIPAGVSLIGDEANKGALTLILGGGTTTVYDPSFISNAVVMGLNTVLAGFTVTNNSGLSGNPMGVLVHGGYSANNVIIRNNTIANSPSIGIYVAGGSGGIVAGNTTANSGGGLVFVGGGGNGMSVYGNTFGDLVELDNLGPDLGGGATGSPGQNSFLGGANPTYFGSGGTVYAMNNHWNHNPPTVGAWPGGFDVGIASTTTVITAGSY